jgi:acetoacetyl-CoA synthetase
MTDGGDPVTMISPERVWEPSAARTAIAEFAEIVGDRWASRSDYAALHAWSVRELESFWSASARFCGVRFHDQPTAVLGSRAMPAAEWFAGATLNYAEHALTTGPGREDTDVAAVFATEDGLRRRLSRGELRDQTGGPCAVRAGTPRGRPRRPSGRTGAELGRNAGDVPRCGEPGRGLVVLFTGFRRFRGRRQVRADRTGTAAVDGYAYGGKRFDIRPTVGALPGRLPTLRATILVPNLDDTATLDGTVPWSEFTAEPGVLEFEPVPFGHPLWVLCSSGTTGLPKGIVHGHGGILLEHLKTLRLHERVPSTTSEGD